MSNIRHFINIVEGRRNPNLNVKKTTASLFAEYEKKYGPNGVYVHYNKIEKVGINTRSTNLVGPVGVYAFPIDMANNYLLYAKKQFQICQHYISQT